MRCRSNDGALPVAAISGSLPWRSASSHWYKATEEPHADKTWSKKQKDTKMEAMLKQRHNNGKQISRWNDGQVWHSEKHTRSMSPAITIIYSKK